MPLHGRAAGGRLRDQEQWRVSGINSNGGSDDLLTLRICGTVTLGAMVSLRNSLCTRQDETFFFYKQAKIIYFQ